MRESSFQNLIRLESYFLFGIRDVSFITSKLIQVIKIVMDFLDSIFDSGKGTLVSITNSLLNSQPVLSAINRKLEKYGEVKKIDKNDDGYRISFSLAGTNNDIELAIKEIVVSDDKKNFSLYGLSSDTLWLNNILKDFVEGKLIPLPENELVRHVFKLI